MLEGLYSKHKIKHCCAKIFRDLFRESTLKRSCNSITIHTDYELKIIICKSLQVKFDLLTNKTEEKTHSR